MKILPLRQIFDNIHQTTSEITMGKAQRKIYGKVVGKDASDRPGWKGPSYVPKKKAPAAAPAPKNQEDEEDIEEPTIPLELQQLLLNIFRDTFPEVLASNDRQALLQSVKNALYERDFARAFGSQENLEIYSVRWSPSRALCYQSVLVDISEHLRDLFPLCRVLDEDYEGDLKGNGESKGKEEAFKTVAFGGGAAEVVAFGGFLKHLLVSDGHEDITSQDQRLEEKISSLSVLDPVESRDASENIAQAEVAPTTTPVANDTKLDLDDTNSSPQDKNDSSSSTQKASSTPLLDLTLIDTAQWGEVVSKLSTSLTSPPPISKYATSHAKSLVKSLLSPSQITTTFHAHDILILPSSQLSTLIPKTPCLLTLLFTLNELYTSSLPLTTKFLLILTSAAVPGTLLLVIDSPGSYSTTTVNGNEKKYPMHWLLAHTLLETAKTGDGKVVWEKVVSEESKWWRVSDELRYPISLENMRFQMHLYRRL